MMGNEGEKIEKEIKICHSEPVVYNWQTITDEFRDACQGTFEMAETSSLTTNHRPVLF